MKIKENFELMDVCGQSVIVANGEENIDFSKIISLNETGASLWKKAKELGEFTTEELANELCQEYEVTYSSAMSDVSSLVKQWQEAELLLP